MLLVLWLSSLGVSGFLPCPQNSSLYVIVPTSVALQRGQLAVNLLLSPGIVEVAVAL